MKTAAVTGASGFLGSYLCANLLSKGYKVIACKHLSTDWLLQKIAQRQALSLENLSWVQADMEDPDSLSSAFGNADVVFHCAAKVSFEHGDANSLLQTNINGTKNVVNACLANGIKTLVFASSVASLGRKSRNNEINENSEWVEGKFNTPYAVSKYQSELEVWRGMEEGLNVAVINPGIILGAGDGVSGSNMIFNHVKKGKKYYPAGVNGFVGVEDVAQMMVLMYEHQVFGKRILAVSENLPYKTILETTAQLLQVKAPTTPFSGFVYRCAYGLARFCEFFHIPFPYPSVGLKNTSSINHYISVNQDLQPWFSFTPIQQVLKKAVAEL